MDSDDELLSPVAPAKPVPKNAPISLDDSDDDLMGPLPPRPAPAASASTRAPAGPASPNARGGGIVLEDSDDDLLPPAPPGMNNSIASPKGYPSGGGGASFAGSFSVYRDPLAAAASVSSPPSSPTPPPGPKPVVPSGSAASPTSQPKASDTNNRKDAAAVDEALNRTKTFVKKQLNKEGFLSKLQPTWPHSPQRRWCVLQGRMFSYYDSQTATKPSATLDLKGAEIIIDPKGAREPYSFGISGVESGSSGNGGAAALKGRVFIFSAPMKEEMMEWVEALRSVLSDGRSDIHWFEKMSQGAF